MSFNNYQITMDQSILNIKDESHISLSWSQQKLQMNHQKQLLLLELNQVKDRYSNLKRQENIFIEAAIPSNCDRCSLSSNYNLKVQELQTQINILTDYISLKDKMYNDNLLKLQQEINHKKIQIHELTQRLSFVEKQTYSHEFSIQLWQEKIQALESQKDEIEQKLNKCMLILKQSEEYYMQQISILKSQNENLKSKHYNLFTPLKQVSHEKNKSSIQLKLRSKSKQNKSILLKQTQLKNFNKSNVTQNNQSNYSYRLKVSKPNYQKQRQNQIPKSSDSYSKMIKDSIKHFPKRELYKQQMQQIDVSIIKRRSISPLNKTEIKTKK